MIHLVEVLILFLTGAVGGFLAGLLGVGGGAIYVIIFTEYFEKKGIAVNSSDVFVKMVIANSVFAILFAGISSTFRQFKLNQFFPREILLTAIPAAIMALLFTFILSISNWYSKEIFSVVFSFLLLPLIIKTAITKEKIHQAKPEVSNPYWLLVSGMMMGLVTAFTGLGGGFLIVPVLSTFLNFPIKKSISISLGAMSIVAFILSSFYFFIYRGVDTSLPFTYGAISFYLTLPVIIGVLIFAPLGVTTAHQLPPKTLRICLLVFFLAVISRMLMKIF